MIRIYSQKKVLNIYIFFPILSFLHILILYYLSKDYSSFPEVSIFLEKIFIKHIIRYKRYRHLFVGNLKKEIEPLIF